MQVTKSLLHQVKLVVKPPLEDQDVWGNKFVAIQGKVVMERSCLVTMHERKVLLHDFWARRGTRGVGEGGIVTCPPPFPVWSVMSMKMKNGERLTPPFSSKGRGRAKVGGGADCIPVISFFDIFSIICGCDMQG